MAKKSEHPQGEKETAVAREKYLWRRRMIGNTFICVMVALYIVWQLYPDHGWNTALLWGGGVGVFAWLFFYITARVSRG